MHWAISIITFLNHLSYLASDHGLVQCQRKVLLTKWINGWSNTESRATRPPFHFLKCGRSSQVRISHYKVSYCIAVKDWEKVFTNPFTSLNYFERNIACMRLSTRERVDHKCSFSSISKFTIHAGKFHLKCTTYAHSQPSGTEVLYSLEVYGVWQVDCSSVTSKIVGLLSNKWWKMGIHSHRKSDSWSMSKRLLWGTWTKLRTDW